MRTPRPVMPALVSAAALLSCGPQSVPPNVDPTLGRACFDAHEPTLPPGSQYEGIAEASETHITIRVMTGTKVETFACSLSPDGAAQVSQD